MVILATTQVQPRQSGLAPDKLPELLISDAGTIEAPGQMPKIRRKGMYSPRNSSSI